jgi:hypothetical protein
LIHPGLAHSYSYENANSVPRQGTLSKDWIKPEHPIRMDAQAKSLRRILSDGMHWMSL